MRAALLTLPLLAACFGKAETYDDPIEGCMGGDTAAPDGSFGVALGDCAEDFTLVDQDGVEVALYDHAGKVILLDLSAMW